MLVTDPSSKPSQRFLQVVQPYFEKQGYDFQKNKKAFAKPFDKGWDTIALNFSIGTLTKVNAQWYVAFEKLERLYAKLLGKPNLHKSFWTVGTDMGNYTRWLNNPQKELPLYNPAAHKYDDFSINQAANDFINFFENYIVPYFKKYNTYESVAKYLNREASFKCVRGLILAKYMEYSDFEELQGSLAQKLDLRTDAGAADERLVFERALDLFQKKDIKILLD